MSEEINFVKMHGLGNDFIIINEVDIPCNLDKRGLALKISDYHFGIGCDQCIIYNDCNDYYDMQIYNRDGSTAMACGNAVRCLGMLVHDNYNKNDLIIKIGARQIACNILQNKQICVNMGMVSFTEAWMPSQDILWSIGARYMIDPKDMICADIGNHHLIIFSNLSNQDKGVIGKVLQEHTAFPDGINVNFASIEEDKIILSVWERGAGFTFACGSGACATFAAAFKLGFVTQAAEIIFRVGSLFMSKSGNDIIMQGPASLVAVGRFCYDA